MQCLHSHTQRARFEHTRQGTHKYMNELEDMYVEVVEKHTLDGANKFTLMKHKHKGHTHGRPQGRGGKGAFAPPPLEIETENENFSEKLKSAAQFPSID